MDWPAFVPVTGSTGTATSSSRPLRRRAKTPWRPEEPAGLAPLRFVAGASAAAAVLRRRPVLQAEAKVKEAKVATKSWLRAPPPWAVALLGFAMVLLHRVALKEFKSAGAAMPPPRFTVFLHAAIFLIASQVMPPTKFPKEQNVKVILLVGVVELLGWVALQQVATAGRRLGGSPVWGVLVGDAAGGPFFAAEPCEAHCLAGRRDRGTGRWRRWAGEGVVVPASRPPTGSTALLSPLLFWPGAHWKGGPLLRASSALCGIGGLPGLVRATPGPRAAGDPVAEELPGEPGGGTDHRRPCAEDSSSAGCGLHLHFGERRLALDLHLGPAQRQRPHGAAGECCCRALRLCCADAALVGAGADQRANPDGAWALHAGQRGLLPARGAAGEDLGALRREPHGRADQVGRGVEEREGGAGKEVTRRAKAEGGGEKRKAQELQAKQRQEREGQLRKEREQKQKQKEDEQKRKEEERQRVAAEKKRLKEEARAIREEEKRKAEEERRKKQEEYEAKKLEEQKQAIAAKKRKEEEKKQKEEEARLQKEAEKEAGAKKKQQEQEAAAVAAQQKQQEEARKKEEKQRKEAEAKAEAEAKKAEAKKAEAKKAEANGAQELRAEERRKEEQEEEARLKAEEQAQSEEFRKRREAEARKQQEEEAARKRQEEEVARKRQEEEEARKQQEAERKRQEEEVKRQQEEERKQKELEEQAREEERKRKETEEGERTRQEGKEERIEEEVTAQSGEADEKEKQKRYSRLSFKWKVQDEMRWGQEAARIKQQLMERERELEALRKSKEEDDRRWAELQEEAKQIEAQKAKVTPVRTGTAG
ncbi:unnamed protein product [Effrenium voratum]|uniref:Reticulocyte-binding protein 2-like a n=1 Tax=Effrenium voratum TaxID=2562239 RepID=A0AA36MP71_9DINO|nr:unnamed protein product [Effrenium voratum]